MAVITVVAFKQRNQVTSESKSLAVKKLSPSLRVHCCVVALLASPTIPAPPVGCRGGRSTCGGLGMSSRAAWLSPCWSSRLLSSSRSRGVLFGNE
ncbi:hypothetical protein M758_UG259200 [Ceratodon purpureus]|nr:hypothetical protein M758_UG259200 [Ceratodon purpureus]